MSTSWSWRFVQHTGMPEFVLMPAPVMTTTLRDFPRVSATACRESKHPGVIWTVGITTSVRERTQASRGNDSQIRVLYRDNGVERWLSESNMDVFIDRSPPSCCDPLYSKLCDPRQNCRLGILGTRPGVYHFVSDSVGRVRVSC